MARMKNHRSPLREENDITDVMLLLRRDRKSFSLRRRVPRDFTRQGDCDETNDIPLTNEHPISYARARSRIVVFIRIAKCKKADVSSNG